MTSLRSELEATGAVMVPRVLGTDRVQQLRDAIERTRAQPGPHYGVLSPPGTPIVDSDLFRWRDDDAIAEVVLGGALPELAGVLLEVDTVVFVEDQWFASAPGASTASPWHQDAPYYNIDEDFLTIWIALDAAPAAAALRVRASRPDTRTVYAPVEFSTSRTTTGGSTTLASPPDPDRDPDSIVLRWDVEPGDAIALHSHTLHSAGGEPVVGRWFRRLSTRWARPSARYIDRGAQAASFWQIVPHGLATGDPLACSEFPMVHPR